MTDHDIIAGWIAQNDRDEVLDAIREKFNCREAGFDSREVWINDPQAGHWLKSDERSGLVAWLRSTGRLTKVTL